MERGSTLFRQDHQPITSLDGNQPSTSACLVLDDIHDYEDGEDDDDVDDDDDDGVVVAVVVVVVVVVLILVVKLLLLMMMIMQG